MHTITKRRGRGTGTGAPIRFSEKSQALGRGRGRGFPPEWGRAVQPEGAASAKAPEGSLVAG